MSKRTNGKERGERIAQVLQAGMNRIKNSDEFKAYLSMAAKFYNYSWGNQLLIWIQNPDATRVATYKNWEKLHNRQVKGNERGMMITTPRPWTRKAKDDEEETSGMSFGVAYVFDVTQTDGEPLPELTYNLEGDDQVGLFKKLTKIAKGEGVSIFSSKDGDRGQAVKGWYSQQNKKIWIRPMSPAMMATTLAHELGHHFAEHDLDGTCASERETIAESVSFIVSTHFGLETGDHQFTYLANWSDDKIFKAKLSEIQKAAKIIIDKVEDNAKV